jgi:hypothetical protein
MALSQELISPILPTIEQPSHPQSFRSEGFGRDWDDRAAFVSSSFACALVPDALTPEWRQSSKNPPNPPGASKPASSQQLGKSTTILFEKPA